jgi:hypothetical protein
MDNADVGSEYYRPDDVPRLTLGDDGMVSCHSDFGIFDVSSQERINDSSKLEDICSIPELPSRNSDELVQVDDVDLHYWPIKPTLELPETPAGKFERNFVDGNVILAASVLVSQAAVFSHPKS